MALGSKRIQPGHPELFWDELAILPLKWNRLFLPARPKPFSRCVSSVD